LGVIVLGDGDDDDDDDDDVRKKHELSGLGVSLIMKTVK
jgi:hypothetical protein